MPRIRSLKPEHKHHRKIGPLTDRQYRLWVGLVTEADDQGRVVADPEQLRALVFGYQPRMRGPDVQAALEQLAATGLIRLYRMKSTQYADLPSWHDHQYVSHASDSKLPSYNDSQNAPEDSGTFRNVPVGSEGIKEGIKDQGGEANRDRPPEAAASAPRRIVFHVPASVTAALDRAPILGAVDRLRRPEFWQAEVRANPGVPYADEILKAEAWLSANPSRAPRKDFPRFVHTWLGRADRNGGSPNA